MTMINKEVVFLVLRIVSAIGNVAGIAVGAHDAKTMSSMQQKYIDKAIKKAMETASKK